MSGLPLGSMQTWHPGQLKGAKKMLSEVNYKATMDKTVEEAKQFVEKAGDDITKQEARRLMENLCEAIETLKSKEAGRRNSAVGISRQTSTAIPSTANFGTIREEPHFESMIFCSPPHSIAARSRSNIAGGDDHRSLTTLESCSTIDAPLTNEKDPLIIRIMPHLLIIFSAVCYVLGGAWVFQQIDEELGQKDYRFIVIFSFQICATIGWGDSHPSHDWSRVFCTAYAIFGVPILFSALSNMGRIISELYCVDWLFLTAVVRGKKNHEQSREIRRRLPIKVAINLLLAHQFIGLILFNGPINDFGVVESVYFSITSMATIGFGDFVPHPKNFFELAVILTYLGTGITLLSALYISISYYFQYFHYVTFVSWMRWFHMKLWNRRKHVKAPKPTENGNATSINNGFIENEKY